MKILFTGGSSLTGMWFVQELLQNGHVVAAVFQKPFEAYAGLRRARVERLLVNGCRPHFGLSFGSDTFLELISSQSWDLLCHHAADVNDYKSPQFNTIQAAANNSYRLPEVLDRLQASGCKTLLLTGSVFEPGEGAGSDQLRAVSPYGLSKGITSEIFRYWCAVRGFSLGKFVIPNPFGPYEEERYTTYLIKTWQKQEGAAVKSPRYVRDNIPVTLLAKSYRWFAEQLVQAKVDQKFNPSGYCGSQADFTERFAQEMRRTLGWRCDYKLWEQKDFSEPLIRINTDPLNREMLGWDENAAWREMADYYLRQYGDPCKSASS